MKPRSILKELQPYVPGKSIPGGIKLSSNENPLGPSPLARQALSAALADPQVLSRYPDGGMHALKERLAELWDITPDMLVVGNGSDEIMVMLAGAFIEPGTNSVTAEHTFSQYASATRFFGGDVRLAPMTNGYLNLEAVRDRIDSQTRLVFLCNPNNPTATTFGHDPLESFLGSIPDHVVVVIDEAYAEFATEKDFPRTLDLIREFPNVMRLRTFSKIYGLASLRVGYGTAQPGLIDAVSRLRQPFNVGTLSQEAARASLDDTGFFEKSVQMAIAGRERLSAFLSSQGCPVLPSQANFVCAHVGPDALDLVSGLAREKIAVRPLDSFGMPEHIRVCVGTPEEMNAFEDAFRRIRPC